MLRLSGNERKFQSITPEEAPVAETESQRAQVQETLYENVSILLGENKSLPTVGASPTGANVSSSGGGATSSEARTSSSGPAATSQGVTTAVSSGVAPSTSIGLARDVPHGTAASTGSGNFTEGAFEVAHDKLAPAQLFMRRVPPENLPDTSVVWISTTPIEGYVGPRRWTTGRSNP